MADLSVSYGKSQKNDLTLADPESVMARTVLLPDHNIYGADIFSSRLALTYQHQLRISGKQLTGFVRAYGNYAHGSHSLDRTGAGITVGLIQ